jgi:hypothetical protein
MRLVLTCFEITSGESAESLVTSMSICGTTSGSSSSSESDSSWSFLSFSSPGMFSSRSKRKRVSRVSSGTTDSIWRIYGTKHVQTLEASRGLPYRSRSHDFGRSRLREMPKNGNMRVDRHLSVRILDRLDGLTATREFDFVNSPLAWNLIHTPSLSA